MTSIPAAICRLFYNNFKRCYLKNGRLFLDFYCISEMCKKFWTFWKKQWVSLPNYFRNYIFGKRLLLKLLEGLASRTPFGNQRVNGFQTPLKVARHHYYSFFPWISGKLSWKKTALLWSKILRLLANTLTADDKYSWRYKQNFLQQLQTPLSEKRKAFFGFFIPFLKFA